MSCASAANARGLIKIAVGAGRIPYNRRLMIAADAPRPPPATLYGAGQALRFTELIERSRADADALLASGLPPGRILAFAVPPAAAMAALRLQLAARLAGHACFPLDPHLTATSANTPASPPATERLNRLAALAGPYWQWLQLDAANDWILPPVLDTRPVASACSGASGPARPTLVIATSGSEGPAKAVMLAAAHLEAAISASATALPLGPGDRWLNVLPLYHIGGQMIFWRCLTAGASMQLLPGFAAATVWQTLQEHPVTHVSLVPTMLARLLEVAGDTPPPAHLRCVLLGGAPLPAALYQQAQALGWPLRRSYGASETSALIAIETPDSPLPAALRLNPGVSARLDADARLWLRGPQIMAGYLNPQLRPGEGLDPESAAKEGGHHGHGWLRTGDRARLLPESGSNSKIYLQLLGRADGMLIVGGTNIQPEEVEALLLAAKIPGIDDLAVLAIPGPDQLPRLALLYSGALAPADLLDQARRQLPKPWQPRAARCVPRLPRNALGKLQRQALPACFAQAPGHLPAVDVDVAR